METISRDGNEYANIDNKWHLIYGPIYDYLNLFMNGPGRHHRTVRLAYDHDLEYSRFYDSAACEFETYYDDWTYDNLTRTFLCNGGELPEQGKYRRFKR